MSKRHHPSWMDSKVLSSWPRVSCWLLSRFSRHLQIIPCLCETSDAEATPKRGTLIADADQQRVSRTVEYYGIFQSEGTSVSDSGSALMTVPGRRLVTFDPMNAHSPGRESLCALLLNRVHQIRPARLSHFRLDRPTIAKAVAELEHVQLLRQCDPVTDIQTRREVAAQHQRGFVGEV